MFLTLVRHGDADGPGNALGDAGRCLSLHGRDQARATGHALAERAVAPTQVWCSPLVRAVQTAELAIAALPFTGTIECRDDLYPDSEPRSLFRALRELPEHADVLVIGHMPYMSTAASELLRMHIGSFATGAAFRFSVAKLLEPCSSRLEWRWQGRFLD